MDVSMTISIRLEITEEKDPRLVEMVGQCEGEYNKLALCVGEQRVDKAARSFGGSKAYLSKEVTPKQFYRAFIFPDVENKARFLDSLRTEE